MENASTNRFGYLEFFAFSFLGLVAIYYLDRLPHGILGLFLGTLITFALYKNTTNIYSWVKDLLNFTFERSILFITFHLLWSLHFYTLYQSRTFESITSPWDLLDGGYWGVLILLLTFTYFTKDRYSEAQSQLITALTYFSCFSLLSILVPIGFGYDRFVHEATIQYIIEHGSITPKQPYYIGLYLPIIALSELTRWSIQSIMTWLLPIASSLVLTWAQRQQTRFPAYLIALYAPLTFTVPFNTVILFFPVLYTLVEEGNTILSVLLAIIAVTIHPLGGTFLFALTLGRILIKKVPRPITIMISFYVSVFAILGPFFLHQLRGGGSILPFSLQAIQSSIDILYKSIVNWHWGWLAPLYAFYYVWPLLICVIGCYYAYQKNKLTAFFYLSQILALNISAILLASHFRFFDIVPGEQYEFAFRLVMLSSWVVLPLLVTSQFTDKLRLLLLPLSIAGVFISYPQFNNFVPFYAPTTSQTDADTVDWIDVQRGDGPYAVLAPQLISAMALRKHHFSQSLPTDEGNIYPYAIPTGDTLYQHYLAFITGRDLDNRIHRVQAFTRNAELYITLDRSWDPYGVLERYLSERAISGVLMVNGRQVYKIQ